jgi:hypothetical protein
VAFAFGSAAGSQFEICASARVIRAMDSPVRSSRGLREFVSRLLLVVLILFAEQPHDTIRCRAWLGRERVE